MKSNVDNLIQWFGAVWIIVGHALNSVGPTAYPWNIVAFFIGTIAFFTWCLRVKNWPQLSVNVVALVLTVTGLWTAFG